MAYEKFTEERINTNAEVSCSSRETIKIIASSNTENLCKVYFKTVEILRFIAGAVPDDNMGEPEPVCFAAEMDRQRMLLNYTLRNLDKISDILGVEP